MKCTKNNIIQSLAWLRNGVCFTFSWLVLLGCGICYLNGAKAIAVITLLRLFLFVFGGMLLFCFWFSPFPFKRMRFFLRLTGFFVIFIPYQLFCLYTLGLFQARETSVVNLAVYFGIALIFYLICLMIDGFVLQKQGNDYTEKLMKYQQKGNCHDDQK